MQILPTLVLEVAMPSDELPRFNTAGAYCTEMALRPTAEMRRLHDVETQDQLMLDGSALEKHKSMSLVKVRVGWAC